MALIVKSAIALLAVALSQLPGASAAHFAVLVAGSSGYSN